MSKQIPNVEESTKFNFITSIWIVPFVALLIAGWLAYQYFSELGPEIRIVFPKNEGLQAGQSQVKYRNIPVGTVKKIELQEDADGIVVVASMDKAIAPFLNLTSKFWIVKPEFSIAGVSGLDTLISGTYINMDATKEEETKNLFLGQEHAYRNDNAGSYFVLNTPKGNHSVQVGTPIYMKNIKVGQVEYVVLALDNASIDIIVYIENQYTPYLRTDSNFWVRSTVDVSFAGGRFDMSVAPVTDLIQGAIEFSSHKKELVCTVPDGFIFKLYTNKGEIENTYLGNNKKQLEHFKVISKEPVAKLHLGAPVRYEGFEVGRVKEISTHYDKFSHNMRSDIILEMNLAVFANRDDTLYNSGKRNFEDAVEEGLRVQLIPTDPITGFLYADLVFTTDEDNQTMLYDGKYSILPTVAYKSGNMMASMTKILDKINGLPLEKLVSSINKVIEDTDKVVLDTGKVVIDTGKVIQNVDKPLVTVLTDLKTTIKNFNKMTNKKSFSKMPDKISIALNELTRTLKTTKKVVKGYGSTSLITRQLADTLKVVTKTSKEMQLFLKMLNRKPNSLIFGDK